MEESIGAAWARFSQLLATCPDWSIPEDVSLHIFYTGLDMDSTDDLDIIAGGSFAHRSPTEGREILDRILRKSSLPSYPCEPQHESQSHHESPSSAESKPIPTTSPDSSVEPSPEPRTSKEEEIQSLMFSSQLEDYLYEMLTHTSSYLCDRRPTASLSSPRKSMNEEWLEGMKRSSEAFRISSPSTTISCSIKGTAIEALHDHCRGLHHVRISRRNLRRKHDFRPDRQTLSKSFRTIL